MAELAVRMVVSLAVVVGLLLLIARFSQKRFKGRSGSPLQVLHRQSLSRSSGVALVSVGGRMLLLGTTDQQVQMLTEIDPVDVDEAAADGYELPTEGPVAEQVSEPEADAQPEAAPGRALVAVPDSLLGSLAGQVDEPARWQPKGAKAPQGQRLAAAATAGTAARAATVAAAAAAPSRPVAPRPTRTTRVPVPAVASFATTLEAELSAAPTPPVAPRLTPAQVLLQEEPDHSPLAGSLLSRDTWRLAARAVSRRAS